MTNENLKVGDVVNRLSEMEVRDFDRDYICDAIDLIESQQSRIEVLESAIREFLYAEENENDLTITESTTRYFNDHILDEARKKLHNLMENEK